MVSSVLLYTNLICAHCAIMMCGMKKLRTTKQVVDTLGLETVCELTGANAKQAWHWYGRAGVFPAKTYVVLTRALRRRGYVAPATLWSMTGIKQAA